MTNLKRALLGAAMLSGFAWGASATEDYPTELILVEVAEEDLQKINEQLVRFRKDGVVGKLRGIVAVELDEETNSQQAFLYTSAVAEPAEACYRRCQASQVWRDSAVPTNVWCQSPGYNASDPNRRVRWDDYWDNKYYAWNNSPDKPCLVNGVRNPQVLQEIFNNQCGARKC